MCDMFCSMSHENCLFTTSFLLQEPAESTQRARVVYTIFPTRGAWVLLSTKPSKRCRMASSRWSRWKLLLLKSVIDSFSPLMDKYFWHGAWTISLKVIDFLFVSKMRNIEAIFVFLHTVHFDLINCIFKFCLNFGVVSCSSWHHLKYILKFQFLICTVITFRRTCGVIFCEETWS